MRESILTIPVSEIFEPKCECPICRMRDMLEKRTVEYIMGAAMMEPDVRIETNKQGFCHTHFGQMQKQKNRLSLALMLQTHLEALKNDALAKPKLLESKGKKLKMISRQNESCFVCDKVNWAMERLMVTVFDMYQNSKEFRQLFSEQEYLCLPHCELLLESSSKGLDKKYQADFKKACISLASQYANSLYADVSHYCSMYDYRNNGENADWGNSKDSIERAIGFLTSRK